MRRLYVRGLCVVLFALVLYLVLYTTLWDAGNVHRFDSVFVNFTILNRTADLQDELQYNRLLLKYYNTLAAVPRHQFKSSDAFKQIGPPLSSILKENASDNATPHIKRILAWTPFFGKAEWIPNVTCAGGKMCLTTANRKDLAISDGLVVHPRDLRGRHDLPSAMLPHQRLIYLIQESPWSTGINVADYNGVFNWTATYRQDSDSLFPFIIRKKLIKPMSLEKYEDLIDNIMATKTKNLAYMNSNCGAKHTNRLKFVKDLRRYMPVDFYGACGNLKCPRFSDSCTRTMSQYKFYLALENTHCRDYITEKITQPLLEWNAVPIVMGGADPSDYERILPPNSFIHSSGFSSTRELAEYLSLLDKNPKLYEEYHKWRRTYKAHTEGLWCNICLALHNTSLPVQVYSDFKGWYREDVCRA